MDNSELIRQWKKDGQAPFEGWDFSYLDDRVIKDSPPWDYSKLAKDLVKKSTAVLDMGTGGGEAFAKFGPFPEHTFAIEGYNPNVSVARKKLEPLGVQVLEQDESVDLPFANAEFNLVLNRHSAFKPKELYRILQKGGVFLTQQVGSENLADLIDEFDAEPKWEIRTLDYVTEELKDARFTIKRSEEFNGKMTFKDVGAIVYFLKAVPWVVEGFSVETHKDYLLGLQKRLEERGSLNFRLQRYLVRAEK